MRRRRKEPEAVQPSLVPMVDLLSNTVGVLVFIMIFTVMAASGVVVLKRLPLEHSTSATPANFLCEKDRILPLNNEDLSLRLRKKWGSPRSIFDIYSWIARYDGIEAEDGHFIARGETNLTHGSYSISTLFTPKPDGGYARQEIHLRDSAYRQYLAALDGKSRFVHFFVRPDGLESFFLARKIAAEEMGFSTGWMPLDTDQPLRFVSEGRAATQQ
ncbi:MAG TPA: hypothetical protein VN844_01490 [Pyrinomonadaceae bacterium]|nr:hypothetical protein [Pyrinomonadaceae bacterium]